MMRWLRRLGWLLLVLLLLAGAALAWWVARSQPVLDGALRVSGLDAPVQVRRDPSDVTHIEASTLRDAMFAIGWVHAQERSWQLELNRRVMRGELSEVLGSATVQTDKLMRTLGIVRAAQAQFDRLDKQDQALLQAYADGVNAFHADGHQALPPEFRILGIAPGRWTPQDSMGWALMMALDLGGNWGNEFARLSLLRTLDTAQLWQLMPPYEGDRLPTQVDLARLYRGMNLYRQDEPAPRVVSAPPAPAVSQQLAQGVIDWVGQFGEVEGKGSNNWVVHGSRSATGKPLLANDPHLGLSAPAVWYFARLKVPASASHPALDVIGATLPGLPSVVLGRTAGVAWGFTNTGPDVQDLYIEEIDTGDASRYRTPGGWQKFETRDETIRVKGAADEQFTVRSTRHGPVLSDAQTSHAQVLDLRRHVIALRWSALDADNLTVRAGLQANFAQTVDELLLAFEGYHAPMQNLVAADTRGRTAFRAIGRVPLRRPDNDLRGIAPAPGWLARYDWAGWLPAAQLPQRSDDDIRARGWHASANQRIHPHDYPHWLTADWTGPERFDRIELLLQSRPAHDLASMQALQSDVMSLMSARLLPVLRATPSRHALAPRVMELLKGFDGTMKADSGAALVMAVWADELTRAVVGARIGEERLKALYGKRHFRQGLLRMLFEPAVGAFWCAPMTCAERSTEALDRTIERLVAAYGNDPSRWQWGQAHPALSSHKPFGNVPLLAQWFDVRVPSPGDSWTVNVGQYWSNDSRMPFANRHAASLRAVYDLSDPERSLFIYQTGQSGLVWSARYRDMRDEWAQVRYRPLQLQPARHAHQLTLNPAR